VPQTGVLPLGDVVYQPGAPRVASLSSKLGAPAQPGMDVLSATSTERVVNVALPVADAALVATGDAVTVQLPDGNTSTAGRITDVATVATVPQDTSGSRGGPPPPVTIALTIGLTDPHLTGSLDQAPVTVAITDRSVHGVLAVPVNALVAPADGGYAIEIVESGRHRLVAVQPGLFANTMVEIRGAGLADGMSVVVPAP
jgi:multidrug efflux system membrane fusion protein